MYYTSSGAGNSRASGYSGQDDSHQYYGSEETSGPMADPSSRCVNTGVDYGQLSQSSYSASMSWGDSSLASAQRSLQSWKSVGLPATSSGKNRPPSMDPRADMAPVHFRSPSEAALGHERPLGMDHPVDRAPDHFRDPTAASLHEERPPRIEPPAKRAPIPGWLQPSGPGVRGGNQTRPLPSGVQTFQPKGGMQSRDARQPGPARQPGVATVVWRHTPPTGPAPAEHASQPGPPMGPAPTGRASQPGPPMGSAPTMRASQPRPPMELAPTGRASQPGPPMGSAPTVRASQSRPPMEPAPTGRARQPGPPMGPAPTVRASQPRPPMEPAPTGRARQPGPSMGPVPTMHAIQPRPPRAMPSTLTAASSSQGNIRQSSDGQEQYPAIGKAMSSTQQIRYGSEASAYSVHGAAPHPSNVARAPRPPQPRPPPPPPPPSSDTRMSTASPAVQRPTPLMNITPFESRLQEFSTKTCSDLGISVQHKLQQPEHPGVKVHCSLEGFSTKTFDNSSPEKDVRNSDAKKVQDDDEDDDDDDDVDMTQCKLCNIKFEKEQVFRPIYFLFLG